MAIRINGGGGTGLGCGVGLQGEPGDIFPREEACLHMLNLYCYCWFHASHVAIGGCCLNAKCDKNLQPAGWVCNGKTKVSKVWSHQTSLNEAVMNEADCTDAWQPKGGTKVT